MSLADSTPIRPAFPRSTLPTPALGPAKHQCIPDTIFERPTLQRHATEIVTDVLDMAAEGFHPVDIVQYLKRTYGLD